MTAKALPDRARAVIVGGGVVGCSVAYHLAKLGWRDIVLVEKHKLTSGTTWHAAGLVGQLRQTANLTRLAKYTADLYAGLEAETGQSTGFRRNGSLGLATGPARLEEFRRGASMARTFGLEVEVLGPAEIADRHHMVNVDDVVGGVFLPQDGQCNPIDTTMALARGARAGGVAIFEDVRVTGIATTGGRVCGVATDAGDIACDYVVNCAGMWARTVGAMAGAAVPLHACEHFYIVTEPIDGVTSGLPVLRDPDNCLYFKEDAGKILVGCFEPEAKPWGMDGIPEDFAFGELPEDFDHFAPLMEAACRRVPALETAGIQTFFNGPESFTPDVSYLLGETPEVRNLFVACGFNSIGIQSAGGAGRAVAEWMEGGEPPFDLWGVDIRRMHPYQAGRTYLYRRAHESLGLLYADHFPYRQKETARGLRRSPLHDRLTARGACFGEVAAYERPNWFATEGQPAVYDYSWGRQNWFANAAAEHAAVRGGTALFDLSSFAKFMVQGPDSASVLERICANRIDVEPGRIVYTQWLNSRGGIEADLTVTRLSDRVFLIVTSVATAVRDMAWLRRNMPDDARCEITDVSGGEAVIAVMGPQSRQVLQSLTSADLGDAAFPFATARSIEVGMAPVRAHRISYVGERGWELYVPAEFAAHVFDAFAGPIDEGAVKLAGYHALDSCRIEKAFRHFGHDITDEDHVLEAGLGFAVRLDKPTLAFGDFLGRAAVAGRLGGDLARRLLQFQLADPEPLVYHNEPIWCGGEMVGHITSGNYGHHLGAAIGMGYVRCAPGETLDDVAGRAYEIEVAGERCPATASGRPLYDPAARRMRA